MQPMQAIEKIFFTLNLMLVHRPAESDRIKTTLALLEEVWPAEAARYHARQLTFS